MGIESRVADTNVSFRRNKPLTYRGFGTVSWRWWSYNPTSTARSTNQGKVVNGNISLPAISTYSFENNLKPEGTKLC